jgi:uncharacterized protein (DUF433 family)
MTRRELEHIHPAAACLKTAIGIPRPGGGLVYHCTMTLDRITRSPEVMGGKPCIRGIRVTVGTIVGLMAAGKSVADVLALYPYLEEEDIRQALAYAAWRVEEVEITLKSA